MSQPELILTVGLPGSGKSTWANDAVSMFDRFHNHIIVERDQIRQELTGDVRDHSQEGRVTRVAEERVCTALTHGTSVIIADTNLRPKYRRNWRKLAESLDAEYIEVWIDTPLDVCIARDSERPNPVGEEVIRKMNEVLLANPRTTE